MTLLKFGSFWRTSPGLPHVHKQAHHGLHMAPSCARNAPHPPPRRGQCARPAVDLARHLAPGWRCPLYLLAPDGLAKKKGLLSRDDLIHYDGWLTICALASSYPIKVVQLSSSNLTAHDKEQPSSSRQGHRSDIPHSQPSFKLVIFRRFERSDFGTPPKSTPGEAKKKKPRAENRAAELPIAKSASQIPTT